MPRISCIILPPVRDGSDVRVRAGLMHPWPVPATIQQMHGHLLQEAR